MINLSDVRTDFQTALARFERINPVKINAPTQKNYIKQYIYSWMALHDLIELLKKQSKDTYDPDADRLERFSVRFVVDRNFHCWFAREGDGTGCIPAHSDMVDNQSVFTAGNLVFSEDYTTIIEITNKSGHYEPRFGTLVFFLALLFSLESNPNFSLKIAPDITLVNYEKVTSFQPEAIAMCCLQKTALQEMIPADVRLQPSDQAYDFIRVRTEDRVTVVEPKPELISDGTVSDTDSMGSTDSIGSTDSTNSKPPTQSFIRPKRNTQYADSDDYDYRLFASNSCHSPIVSPKKGKYAASTSTESEEDKLPDEESSNVLNRSLFSTTL
jgi:hypothetical protein